MSAYRKLTETLRDAVAANLSLSKWSPSSATSWSRTLALLEEELRVMGDDE